MGIGLVAATLFSSVSQGLPALCGSAGLRREAQRISSYRSRQASLVSSINASFHDLFHALSALSRIIALSMVSWLSYQTSVCTSWRFVNPSTKLFLCCQTRWGEIRGHTCVQCAISLAGEDVDAGRFSWVRVLESGRGLCRDDIVIRVGLFVNCMAI